MNTVPGSMWEWLAPIQPDQRFALSITTIVICLTALVFVIGLVSHTIGKFHRARLESALKHELLNRGMSADEIAQIVEASAAPRGLRLKIQKCGSAREAEHAGLN